MKTKKDALEKRFIGAEVRAEDGESGKHIVGVAPVYNQRADIGPFIEIIEPGALDDILQNADVRGRFDHNTVLARTKNGTLKLSNQPDGLHYDITINENDPEALAAYAKIQRGDVDGSSFMFNVADGGDTWTKEGKTAVRTIHKMSEFLDVGPVAFPAYPQTSAQARSMLLSLNLDLEVDDEDDQTDPEDAQDAQEPPASTDPSAPMTPDMMPGMQMNSKEQKLTVERDRLELLKRRTPKF